MTKAKVVTEEFLTRWERECELAGRYLPSVQVDGNWEEAPDGAQLEPEFFTCPTCGGEGEVEGQRYDAEHALPATLVAYGIGKGLEAAERWAEGSLDATRALLAEVRRLRAEVARG